MSDEYGTDDPYERLDRDIGREQQTELFEVLSEAASIKGAHKDIVQILERDRHDAINVTVRGIVEWDGKEYTFTLEDGNRRGTVLLGWNDDVEFVYRKPVIYALQPFQSYIDSAIAAENGPFLIFKWDAMLDREPYRDLIRKYTYDQYFSPGGRPEAYWRAEAAKGNFDIVLEETAMETRKRLMEATRGV